MRDTAILLQPRRIGNVGLRELSVARTGKERFKVLTEFFRRNDTHYFIVEFFEVVNITHIPWRDDHSGAKPSVDP